MMYIYKYEIQYYNTVEEKTENKNGILAATTYENATSILTRYYGDDNIFYFRLEVLDDIVEIRSIDYVE